METPQPASALQQRRNVPREKTDLAITGQNTKPATLFRQIEKPWSALLCEGYCLVNRFSEERR